MKIKWADLKKGQSAGKYTIRLANYYIYLNRDLSKELDLVNTGLVFGVDENSGKIVMGLSETGIKAVDDGLTGNFRLNSIAARRWLKENGIDSGTYKLIKQGDIFIIDVKIK